MSTGDFDADGSEEYCGGYWLSSVNAYNAPNYLMCLGCSGTLGNSTMGIFSYRDKKCGIRPVICLSGDVEFVESDDIVGDGRDRCFEIV